MVHGDKADAPMLFSRTIGFSLPHRWEWGTCIIAIDVVQADGHDIFRLSHIGFAVLDIVDNCVTNDIHEVGGKTRIGSENAMRLFVIGRNKPEREWPITKDDD